MMRALLIDLNNFSRYPTLPVGYLTAILRKNDFTVDVLSPFAKGVDGYPRLTRARPFEYYLDKLKYWSQLTSCKPVREIRKLAKKIIHPGNDKDKSIIFNYTKEFLENSPDIVLISTYTMYKETCREICKLCLSQDIPVIIGGNYFIEPDIIVQWKSMPGISAVYAGEPESDLIKLIHDVVQGKQIDYYPGVTTKSIPPSKPSPVFTKLDALPFPDYSDFPWEAYPNRIIPIMTGRGCGWGNCTFCSDIITSAGRSYRSRGIDNVMNEIAYQSTRFHTTSFVFLDLKLNSNLELWRGLITRLPGTVPEANWTASVHVDNRQDNGLSYNDLIQARKAGLSRISFGLESGSPKVLKLMAKGIHLKRVSSFLKDAHRAGLSIRITCMVGYPGEQGSDILLTSRFLQENKHYIERVILNPFILMAGTSIVKHLTQNPTEFPEIHLHKIDTLTGIIPHYNSSFDKAEYRGSVYKLMKTVHTINRKALLPSASEFEGVM